ncbi:MAG: N-formylglutamate amidohydrolase [Rhodospirillales bacterium]|jgi:N-formylglutamate deformylase|nr:N-formylglutamate amidohydrolase [Rhodospirillales bacterium]
MDGSPIALPLLPDMPVTVHHPLRQTVPVVFASPHSGRAYPAEFIAAARLDPLGLRRSEDSFVDLLFADAPANGAPLLAARFPRAYCDANREAWELDPGMFEDRLPDFVNTASPRVGAGLGTIPRVVASGEGIYRHRLSFAEAERRIRDCWEPYHATLAALIEATRAQFGACLLIDCHSMPSLFQRDGARGTGWGAARPNGRTAPPAGPDIVLGDAHGTACAPAVTRFMDQALRDLGYLVRRNDPYAGGYVTRHYGRPREGVHVLQLELARALYMDETRIEALARFDLVREDVARLIGRLTAEAAALLAG